LHVHLRDAEVLAGISSLLQGTHALAAELKRIEPDRHAFLIQCSPRRTEC
jgi:hypothetical protein